MDLIIDLDGTICEERPAFERCLAAPLPGAIEAVNDLYFRGNRITIYTARGWGELKATEEWLKKNNVQYHNLIMGKPIGQVWIDDRAIQFKGDWKDITKQLDERKKK